MKKFMDSDFLLTTETAKTLFHNYAEKCPIIDYHNHLSAKDIYEQTGLDFLGIDLLFGKDKPYFCEINVMPGIEGMERATGVNVAGAIMDTIIGDFQDDH